MLLTSFSVISSSSSFPSISNLDSPFTSSPIRNRTVYSSRRCLKFTRPPFQFSSLHASRPFSLIVRASSSKQVIEEGSVDKFLQNASMADFLRFKQGIDGGSGELQTAIVSYRKKFPWSLLYPFLQGVSKYQARTHNSQVSMKNDPEGYKGDWLNGVTLSLTGL